MGFTVHVTQHKPEFTIDRWGGQVRLPYETVSTYGVDASSFSDAVAKAKSFCDKTLRRLTECRIFDNGEQIGRTVTSNCSLYPR